LQGQEKFSLKLHFAKGSLRHVAVIRDSRKRAHNVLTLLHQPAALHAQEMEGAPKK
jgi:hypothetical protein